MVKLIKLGKDSITHVANESVHVRRIKTVQIGDARHDVCDLGNIIWMSDCKLRIQTGKLTYEFETVSCGVL